MAIAAIAALGCVGVLGLPVAANAAEAPLCGGSLELNNEIPGIDPPGGLSYKFNCNSLVVGYGIVSNRQVDYFSTEVLVLDFTSGEATSESFGCEGAFPSSGFGCRGVSNFGNAITGEFAIGRDPCEAAKSKSDKFKVWVTATVIQPDSVTNKPITTVTQPFRLKNPTTCKAATSRKESRR
ncbi:MAG TPA: hypothetical protein VGO66_05790 [Solirubrobacterales bacterium]|nr:hypothetical protein [Solirubrobacterales bacterium]